MKIIVPSILFVLLETSHASLRRHKKQEPEKKQQGVQVKTFTLNNDTSNQNNKKKKKTHSTLNINHNNYNPLIVGGDDASPGDYPWFVDLNGCGGSLIANRVVLTAAHCGNLVNYYALVGGYDRWDDSTHGQKIRIVDRKAHPGYDSGSEDNDFQLLLLESEPTIAWSTVAINSSGNNPSSGDTLVVIGVGDTSEGGSQADTLQYVEVPYVSQSDCEDAYSGWITENMFCAGDLQNGGIDSCQGDSGGPILGEGGAQVGVVSWGSGCARPGAPGVYARVSEAYSWIQGVACNTWDASGGVCNGDDSGGGGGGGDGGDGGDGGSDIDCKNDEITFDFIFTTDEFGYETTWEIRDSDDRNQESGGSYNGDKSYREQRCLDDGCYTLVLKDSYGDGICCGQDPKYELKIDGSTVASAGNEDFGDEKIIPFGNCGGDGGGDGGGGDNGGDCKDLNVDFFLTTDDYPDETSWEITKDGKSEATGGDYNDRNKEYHEQRCLEDNGCYTLTLYDSYGDGLCCGKDQGFVLNINGDEIANSNDYDLNFGDDISFNFGDCGGGGGGGDNGGDGGGDNGGDDGGSDPPPPPPPPQCVDLQVELRSDDWGDEITVALVDYTTEEFLLYEDNIESDEKYDWDACLNPDHCVHLEVMDSHGDGLLDGGKVKVKYDGDKVYEGGDYGSLLILEFGNC